MKKLWNYLDGHKTWLFMTASAVLQQAVNYDLLPDNKWTGFAIGLTFTFGGGSLLHKGKKKFLNKK